MSLEWVGQRAPQLPPICDPEDISDSRHASELRNYLNWWFRWRTTKRAELERGWNRARLYHAAKQWLQPFRRAGAERLWYAWEPLRLPDKSRLFPRPVINVFSKAIHHEVAWLIGVGSRPYVRVDDPDKREGAELAKQVLLDRNEKTEWEDDQRTGAYAAAMFGQWIECSSFEFDVTKTTAGPPTEAVMCKPCGFLLREPEVDGKYVPHLTSAYNAVEQSLDPYAGINQREARNINRVVACPRCGHELEPVEDMPESMWRSGRDSLERSLTVHRAIGEDVTWTASPYDFYPENQGVGYESDRDMQAFGLRQPLRADWVKNRFEMARRLNIKPYFDAEIFSHHPMVLTAGMGHTAAFSDGIWQEWGILDRLYIKPSSDEARGRAIVMWGLNLLMDDEYFHPETDIPRVECAVAQWEKRHREIWGKPEAEDLFSRQDNINSTKSQMMNIRQKWTDPKLVLHAGMNFRQRGGPGDLYSTDILEVDWTGVTPEIAAKFPMTIGEKSPSSQIAQELKDEIEMVEKLSGQTGAATGDVSGVEFNYSALLFSATKSAEVRKPRTAALRRLKRKIWTHRLRNIANFYREDRLIHYRDDSNEWAVKQVRGFMLQGQTDVALEDEPLVDSAIAERASIDQAVQWGTIRPTKLGGSYVVDRKLNRAINLPPELNEDRNIQEDNAHAEWMAWVEKGIEPVVDLYADEHQIHGKRHALDLEGPLARKLHKALAQRDIEWGRDVLIACWEWERMLDELTGMRALVTQAVSEKPIEKMIEFGFPEPQILDAQNKLMVAARAVQGFPAQLDRQIFVVWMRLLQASRQPKLFEPQGTLFGPLLALVRMKAHLLAHNRILMGTSEPQAPAPGETSTGPAPVGSVPSGPGPNPAQMAAIAGAPVPGAGA